MIYGGVDVHSVLAMFALAFTRSEVFARVLNRIRLTAMRLELKL